MTAKPECSSGADASSQWWLGGFGGVATLQHNRPSPSPMHYMRSFAPLHPQEDCSRLSYLCPPPAHCYPTASGASGSRDDNLFIGVGSPLFINALPQADEYHWLPKIDVVQNTPFSSSDVLALHTNLIANSPHEVPPSQLLGSLTEISCNSGQPAMAWDGCGGAAFSSTPRRPMPGPLLHVGDVGSNSATQGGPISMTNRVSQDIQEKLEGTHVGVAALRGYGMAAQVHNTIFSPDPGDARSNMGTYDRLREAGRGMDNLLQHHNVDLSSTKYRTLNHGPISSAIAHFPRPGDSVSVETQHLMIPSEASQATIQPLAQGRSRTTPAEVLNHKKIIFMAIKTILKPLYKSHHFSKEMFSSIARESSHVLRERLDHEEVRHLTQALSTLAVGQEQPEPTSMLLGPPAHEAFSRVYDVVCEVLHRFGFKTPILK